MQAEIKIRAEAMSEDISPSSSESESSELIDAVCPNTKNSQKLLEFEFLTKKRIKKHEKNDCQRLG